MSKTSNAAADIATITQIAKSIQADINTILPIADVPTNLALEAHKRREAINRAQLIERLRDFRIEVEMEAETSINNIPTDLGLALADVTEALGIEEPDQLRHILGPATYLATYVDPIPYQPAHPPLHKVYLILAKVRDIWQGKWMDAFPVPPPA